MLFATRKARGTILFCSFLGGSGSAHTDTEDILKVGSMGIEFLEQAVPTSLMWEATGKAGGWLATGVDIAKAPSRVANGESRGRVLSGMMASTFVELQLQAKVVPYALKTFCKHPEGLIGGGTCVAGVAATVATVWKTGEITKESAEDATTELQHLANPSGEPGLRLTQIFEDQDGTMQLRVISSDMCIPNEGSPKDVLKSLAGYGMENSEYCRITATQETSNSVNVASECKGFLTVNLMISRAFRKRNKPMTVGWP